MILVVAITVPQFIPVPRANDNILVTRYLDPLTLLCILIVVANYYDVIWLDAYPLTIWPTKVIDFTLIVNTILDSPPSSETSLLCFVIVGWRWAELFYSQTFKKFVDLRQAL